VIDLGIDESRIAGRNVLVVSAVIGQTSMMRKLAREWKKDLADNGVDYFHAKDHWNGRSKPYHGLSNQKRRELLQTLIADVHRFAHIGLSVSINIEEYERLTTPRFRSDWGAPYAFAIQMMMLLIYIDLKERKREHEVVNFLIEDGNHVGQAYEIISKVPHTKEAFLNLGTLTRGGKLNNPILQAADLLAYGCCQYVSTGQSRVYMQLVARHAQQFPRLECSEKIIEMIQRDINANFERRRELRLRERITTTDRTPPAAKVDEVDSVPGPSKSNV